MSSSYSSSRHSSRNCANGCHRPADKHRSDHLCLKCAHKLPRTQCFYCHKDFLLLSRQSQLPAEEQLCDKCSADESSYGAPGVCQYCRFQSAFDGATLCRHCKEFETRFGAPIECEKCHFQCAFRKETDSLDKVYGKNLCFVCTLHFKTLKKKESEQQKCLEAFELYPVEQRPDAAQVEAVQNRRGAKRTAVAGGSNEQNGDNSKRQKLHSDGSHASISNSESTSQPLSSPSPSPSSSSISLSASPPVASSSSQSLISSASSGSTSVSDAAAAAAPAASLSHADLLARCLRLEKELAELRKRDEDKTQRLLVLGSKVAESKRVADEATQAKMSREVEVNALRGELAAARNFNAIAKAP